MGALMFWLAFASGVFVLAFAFDTVQRVLDIFTPPLEED